MSSAIALPALMINLLSSFSAQHEPDLFQYNAAIVPFLALGTIRGAAWLGRRSNDRTWRRPLGVFVTMLLLAGGLSYHLDYGHTPLAAHFRMPRCDVRCATRQRFVARIPQEASVSAQTTLVPHLSRREFIVEYPEGLSVADYVLLDVISAHYSIPLTDDFYASIESLWLSKDFSLLAAEDGYLLFQRGQYGQLSDLPSQFYNYTLIANPALSHDLDLLFGPLRLIGIDVELAREGQVKANLYWQAQEPVPPGYRPSIALGLSGGELAAWHRQDLPFRWEQRGWQPGDVLRLTTAGSTGHGAGVGWGTNWTLYAGVVDDATGAWFEPREIGDHPVSDVLYAQISGKKAGFIPLAWLRNNWGITILEKQRYTGH